MNARDEILARTRLGLTAPELPAEPVGITFATPDALLERFVERLVDYKADVSRCTADGLAAAIAAALGDATRVVVPADLPATWLSAFGGETVSAPPGEVSNPAQDANPAQDSNMAQDSNTALDGVDAVVTGCAVAVAETGTIVLDAGAAQGPRRLSLIPDRHVLVVRDDQVEADVPDAVALLTPTRPLTWISGPSATSDIELNRVEGVHGPRHLHVILVQPAVSP